MFRRFLEEPYKPDSLEVALEHLMTEVEHTEPTEGQINSDQNQNWKFGSFKKRIACLGMLDLIWLIDSISM